MTRMRLAFTVAALAAATALALHPPPAVAAARAPASVAATAAPRRAAVPKPRVSSQAAPASVCALPGLVTVPGSRRCPAKAPGFHRQVSLPGPDPLPVPLPPVGGIVTRIIGTKVKSAALSTVVSWVTSGAQSALKNTAKVIDASTRPNLDSSWFSSSYWRIAAIAALLTMPFLCAAAVHALVRSDLSLLTRAAFGYLPLSLLATAIASQLTMLLLAATDEMSSIVSSASSHDATVFLATASVRAIGTSVAVTGPFVAFLAAVITVLATLALWIELLVRDAAVYVIVLMLPLFFAAIVWPARRTLASRAVETLIALILSKFAIVAVLSLGGAALGHSATPGAISVLLGATLVLLAAGTPWALLRILPLHEVAAAAAGSLSHGPKQLAVDTVAGAKGAVALGATGVERLGARREILAAASSAGSHRRFGGPSADDGGAPSPDHSDQARTDDPARSAAVDADVDAAMTGVTRSGGGFAPDVNEGSTAHSRPQDDQPAAWGQIDDDPGPSAARPQPRLMLDSGIEVTPGSPLAEALGPPQGEPRGDVPAGDVPPAGDPSTAASPPAYVPPAGDASVAAPPGYVPPLSDPPGGASPGEAPAGPVEGDRA